MSWQIEFDEERQVIFLTFKSDISKKDIHESSAAFIKMMQDKSTRKILTDFTDAQTLAASTFDIYYCFQYPAACGGVKGGVI
ncbi:MAG: hypothetical protein SWH78_13460 [Thermodesulfobacteriota bacterium]|nr:hypothetical protein [Thermodesulfobacteriota bacterium]